MNNPVIPAPIMERARLAAARIEKMEMVIGKEAAAVVIAQEIMAVEKENSQPEAKKDDGSLWRFWNNKARNLQYAITELQAENERLKAENEAANREARILAHSMWEQSYSHVTEWKMLKDTAGIITQISNMAAGIRDRATLSATPSTTSPGDPQNS